MGYLLPPRGLCARGIPRPSQCYLMPWTGGEGLLHIPEIPMFAHILLLGRKELGQGWHVEWSLAALVMGAGTLEEWPGNC